MSKILITPEEVRGVASQFKSSSGESSAMVQKLSSAVSQMQQNWAGMSSQKFYQDFQTWQKEMQRFVGLLDQINNDLLAIAQRFEQADRVG